MRMNDHCVKLCLFTILAVGSLTACGSAVQDGSVISVSKDGTVSDTIRESFEEDYYSQQELQDEILKAVASYNAQNGNDAISVSKVSVEDGCTDVEMKYQSAKDYKDFNGEIFFVGTPAEARLEGFDLNKVFTSVSDSSETMGMAELFNTEGVLVLITDTDQTVNLEQKILYISDEIEMLDKSKTFRLKKDENDEVSGEACVIFKE